MKQQPLITSLTNIGLSDNEARIYIAALSLRQGTILAIAKVSGIKRTTVYSVIESLQKKGLISIKIDGFKKRYVAESPHKLEHILTERKQQLEKSLPELLGLYTFKSEEGTIKYYEGLRAVKMVYEENLTNLKKNDFYYVVSDQNAWYQLDSDYFQNFIKRRASLAGDLVVDIRLLLTDSSIARSHRKIEREYNEKIIILPKKTVLTTNLIITPRRVIIHQLVKPVFALLIQNKSIIQMHRECFEIMWKLYSTPEVESYV